MSNFNTSISKYPSAASSSVEVTNLLHELNNIRCGKYQREVLACRRLYDEGDKIKYKQSKTFLPALTFSGLFNGSHKKENLNGYSNFMIIDIDAVDKAILKETKVKLFEDKFVSAVWISPSGCGLKVLVNILSTANEHKICFDTLSIYLNKNYSVEVDKSGSDVCRLCFVSFDDKLLMKESFVRFDYKEFYVGQIVSNTAETNIIKPKTKKELVSTQSVSERVIFEGTENRNNQRDRDTLVKIIKYLKKNKRSITSSYGDWFRVACVIANIFTYDLGQKYYLELCRLDGALHDEYKSFHLLEYCYRNRKKGELGFPTIIFLAKEKGFVTR